MATDVVTVSPTYNGDSVPLTAGMIVRLKPGANNNVVRAQADSAAHVQGVNGVVISGSCAPGTAVLVTCVGRQTVQMESGLTLDVSDTVFVSATVAGKGTNVAPGQVAAIGSIADTSNYTRLGTVEVDVVIPASEIGAGGTFPGYGAGVAGPTAVGAAGSASTVRRSDQTTAAYRSDLPLSPTWFVDPVNGSDAASNPGTTSATALKSLSEVRRRMWSAAITTNTTITILGDLAPTDTGPWNTQVGDGATLTIIGSIGPTTGFGGAAIDNTLYTGSVSAFAAASNAGPSADDMELTDSSIPVSFTASGLLAASVLFRRNNSTHVNWYALKDLGSKTIRISNPVVLSAGTFQTLTPGDTYSAYHLWNVPAQFFQYADNVIFDSVTDLNNVAGNSFAYPQRFRCWIATGLDYTFLGVETAACMFDLSPIVAPGAYTLEASNYYPYFVQCCAFKGSGSSILTTTNKVVLSGPSCFQGVQLQVNDRGYISLESSHQFNDCTISALTANANSLIALLGAGIFISGKGNTSKLLTVQNGGSWMVGSGAVDPSFNAGSTSDVSPISINGTSFSVAAVPAGQEVAYPSIINFPSSVYETGGPTPLSYGAIPAGSILQRSGSQIVGVLGSAAQTALTRAQALCGNTVTQVLGTHFENDQFYTIAGPLSANGTAVLSQTEKAGVVVLSTTAAANSYVEPQPHGLPAYVDNPKTTPWYAVWRMALTSVGDVQTTRGALMVNPNAGAGLPFLLFGNVGSVSLTKLSWELFGNSAALNLGSDAAITLDTNYHTLEMWCDTVNLNLAYDGVVVFTIAVGAANFPTNPITLGAYVANGATAAAQTENIDYMYCCMPPN